MTHRIPALLLIWLLGAVAFASLIPAVAHAAPAVCSCADKDDLLNRLRQAKAAIEVYEKKIVEHGDERHPLRFDRFYENEIQPGVQAAITAVTTTGGNRVAGSTDPGTCDRNPNTVVEGTETKCLRATIDTHEGVHVAECSKWKKSKRRRIFTWEYRGATTVAIALQNEIDAYEAEIAFIKRQIALACPLGWRVDVDLVVSGEGGRTVNELNRMTWKVMHKYSGSMEVTTGPVPTASLVDGKGPTPAQLMSGVFAQQWMPASTGAMPSITLDVEIDDEAVSYSKDPGEGPAWEATTHKQTWKGKGKDATHGIGMLVIDEAGKLHSLTFEMQPTSKAKQLVVAQTDIIDRTEFGYGGAPTHQVVPGSSTKEPFSTIALPVVAGVLNGHLTLTKKPFVMTNDSFTFDATLERPPGYLDHLPDVQRKLKIRVTYRVTKIAPE